MLYDIIYDYFYGLFNSTNISGYHTTIMSVDTTLAQWLGHTTTIIVMALLITFMFLVVRWCFRVFSGLFKGL